MLLFLDTVQGNFSKRLNLLSVNQFIWVSYVCPVEYATDDIRTSFASPYWYISIWFPESFWYQYYWYAVISCVCRHFCLCNRRHPKDQPHPGRISWTITSLYSSTHCDAVYSSGHSRRPYSSDYYTVPCSTIYTACAYSSSHYTVPFFSNQNLRLQTSTRWVSPMFHSDCIL